MKIIEFPQKIKHFFSGMEAFPAIGDEKPMKLDFESLDAFIQSCIVKTKKSVEKNGQTMKRTNELLWFIMSQVTRIKTKKCISVSQFQKMMKSYFELCELSGLEKAKIRFSHSAKEAPYFMLSATASVFIGIIDQFLRQCNESTLLFFVLLQKNSEFTLLAEKNNFFPETSEFDSSFNKRIQEYFQFRFPQLPSMMFCSEFNMLKVVSSEKILEDLDMSVFDYEMGTKLITFDFGVTD